MSDWTADVSSTKTIEMHCPRSQRSMAKSPSRSGGGCPAIGLGLWRQLLSPEGTTVPRSPCCHCSLPSQQQRSLAKRVPSLYKHGLSRMKVWTASGLSSSGPQEQLAPNFLLIWARKNDFKNWHEAERQLKRCNATVSIISHSCFPPLTKVNRQIWCCSSDLVNYHHVHRNQKSPHGKNNDRKGQHCLYKWHLN